ncbi:MAG TPA: hypothetical protein VGD54_20930 [Steroidobacteraceae bacterium]
MIDRIDWIGRHETIHWKFAVAVKLDEARDEFLGIRIALYDAALG